MVVLQLHFLYLSNGKCLSQKEQTTLVGAELPGVVGGGVDLFAPSAVIAVSFSSGCLEVFIIEFSFNIMMFTGSWLFTMNIILRVSGYGYEDGKISSARPFKFKFVPKIAIEAYRNISISISYKIMTNKVATVQGASRMVGDRSTSTMNRLPRSNQLNRRTSTRFSNRFSNRFSYPSKLEDEHLASHVLQRGVPVDDSDRIEAGHDTNGDDSSFLQAGATCRKLKNPADYGLSTEHIDILDAFSSEKASKVSRGLLRGEPVHDNDRIEAGHNTNGDGSSLLQSGITGRELTTSFAKEVDENQCLRTDNFGLPEEESDVAVAATSVPKEAAVNEINGSTEEAAVEQVRTVLFIFL